LTPQNFIQRGHSSAPWVTALARTLASLNKIAAQFYTTRLRRSSDKRGYRWSDFIQRGCAAFYKIIERSEMILST
jgi:hypothetical protein